MNNQKKQSRLRLCAINIKVCEGSPASSTSSPRREDLQNEFQAMSEKMRENK